jgi:predicted AlkP superfamily phosphohydrolase/phosphomutase
VVDDILARVLAARDPEGGASPVLFGARREDVYRGRYVDKAPDLVFLARPPYYLINEEGDKEPFGTPAFSFSAHHEIHGILIASGPMFGKGHLEGRQGLIDITPTLMYLAGLSVPGYMEGDVLTPLFAPEYAKAHPVVREAGRRGRRGTRIASGSRPCRTCNNSTCGGPSDDHPGEHSAEHPSFVITSLELSSCNCALFVWPRRSSCWPRPSLSCPPSFPAAARAGRRRSSIGLDGADWDLLVPWMEAGELPNLKAFLETAALGDLTTVHPILSPVCWTSGYTGSNPGKHGIFDFQKTDPSSGELLIETATHRRAQPIWMLLSDVGKKVGVMNVPMTYPPDPVRGSMISGFLFPSGDVNITYPPEPRFSSRTHRLTISA